MRMWCDTEAICLLCISAQPVTTGELEADMKFSEILSKIHNRCDHCCSETLKVSKNESRGSRMTDFSWICWYQPSQKCLHHAARCCTACHSTHTRLHCVQRQHVPLARPPSCSPFTVRCCFSVISRLIGGEISSVMAALDWWISSLSYICSTTLLPGSISA